MESVLIGKIEADVNQPRKYFAAEKMHTLKESIKKHGIKVPVVVEPIGNGKYKLIDGERRFRAATELKLKTVPALIEEPKPLIDRLIEQFQIQEQHEPWTAVEKANALITISKETGLSLKETMNLLNISRDVQRRYGAFAMLADRTTFVRSNISMDWAPYMLNLRNAVERLTDEQEESFSRADEKKLETRVVQLIMDGDLKKRGDISKIHDSFVKNPKLISKFLNTKITSAELYKEAKAKGTYHLRNATNNAQYVCSHARAYLLNRDVKISPAQLITFKNAKKELERLIDAA